MRCLLLPRVLPAALFAAFIAAIVVLAGSGYRASMFGFVDVIPYGDKLGHLGLMGTLSLLVSWSLYPRTLRLGRASLPLGVLLVLLVTTLEECSQRWFPARSFSLLDLACNVVGIVVGGLLASLLARHGQSSTARTVQQSESRG
jgi:polysaccharide biosynthesis protein VpsQ